MWLSLVKKLFYFESDFCWKTKCFSHNVWTYSYGKFSLKLFCFFFFDFLIIVPLKHKIPVALWKGAININASMIFRKLIPEFSFYIDIPLIALLRTHTHTLLSLLIFIYHQHQKIWCSWRFFLPNFLKLDSRNQDSLQRLLTESRPCFFFYNFYKFLLNC